MATSVGAVFLEVVPSLDKFASMLSAGTVSDVKRIGQNAGKQFGESLSAGSKVGLDALKSQLSTAALATERASTQVASAHATAATAAGRVEIAEARLAEARTKHAAESSVVVAAEKNLERAKRDSELQSGKTTLAEKVLADSQDKQALSAGKLKDAQEAGTVTSAKVAKGAGVLAVGVVGAATALGVIGVKSAANFETQLTRLATSAGESTNSLKLVGDGILKISGDVGTSSTELSSGMYTIESAGYHGADGLTVLKAAAQGAKLENAQLKTVANAVTDVLVDYHLPAQQAADVTSKLVTAVSLGKTNFEELSGAMSSVAPIAAAAHIPLQDLLGSLSEMTAHGVSADQAAQNLANTIRSLSNPTSIMTEELGQVGIRSDELSANLGKTGVSGALIQVSEAILAHMGPSGTVLLNTFNQSKIAAEDANRMFQGLPPNLQKLAKGMQDGTVSQHEWTQGLKSVDPIQANLLKQWLTATKHADGFSQALKSGSTASQDYTQALAKATGNSTSMNVALMLTGENAAATKDAVSKIAEATDAAGGNVAGWSDIQGTFNQKLSQAKYHMEAFVTQIGQKLLPVATAAITWAGDFAKGLGEVGAWAQRNATWIGLVASVIGGLLGPLLVVKGAMQAWKLATDAVKSAQVALNIVQNMSPTMRIVMAIGALVAGLIYAYTHFKTFHDIVNAVGSFLRDVFMATIHGLVAAFEWVVHAGEAVGHFFAAVFTPVIHAVSAAVGWVVDHWRIFAVILAVIFAPITIAVGLFVLIVTHARQIGAAFVWLWNVILKPVFDFIAAAVVILAKIILAILIAPVVIAIRVFGALFSWLYDVAIKPAFDAIGAGASWLYNNAIKPAFDGIGAAVEWVYQNVLLRIWNGLKYDWQLLQDALKWLYENVFKPVWEAIGAAVDWVYQNVLLRIWNGLKVEWQLLQDALKFLYDHVFRPIWDALGRAVDWVYRNVLLPIWDGLKYEWRLLQDALNFLYENVFRPVWSALGDAISWVYHNVIEPVWNYFKRGLSNLEDDFRSAVSHIGDIWDGLKRAFGTPIEFVIRTVLNDGLIKGINNILSVVGLSIPTIPDPNLPTFATGGVVPGFAPGQDTVHALLSPGEGVLVPHAVRALGGEGGIAAINSLFGGGGGPSLAHGLPGFGLGGFVSDALGGLGSAWNAVKNVALGGLRAAAQSFFDGVIHPLVNSIPGGSDNIAKRMLSGLADNVEHGILDFLGKKDSTAGGTIPVGDHLAVINAALAADGIPAGQWAAWQSGMNTLIQRESGWNAGAVNNSDSNAKAGTPSMGLAQVIAPTFAAYRNRSLVDSLLDPVANVAASINYILARYGGIGAVQQANPNLPPQGYDEGGYLQPGMSRVLNATGRPEPVFTSRQWDVLKARLKTDRGGDTNHYHITTTDPIAVATEIERRTSLNLTAKL